MSELRPLSDLDVIERLRYSRGRASEVENVQAVGRGVPESLEGDGTKAARVTPPFDPAHSGPLAEPPQNEEG